VMGRGWGSLSFTRLPPPCRPPLLRRLSLTLAPLAPYEEVSNEHRLLSSPRWLLFFPDWSVRAIPGGWRPNLLPLSGKLDSYCLDPSPRHVRVYAVSETLSHPALKRYLNCRDNSPPPPAASVKNKCSGARAKVPMWLLLRSVSPNGSMITLFYKLFFLREINL